MTDAREAVAREWLRRLSDKEYDRLGELLTEDAQMELIPYNGEEINENTTVEYPNPLDGRDMIVKIFTASGDLFEDLRFTVDTVYRAEDSDAVIVEYRSSATVIKSGKPFGDHYLAVMKVRGDQLYLWREWHDPGAFIRASTPD